jgi:uncharacterized membrane-anchored protein
LLASAELVTVVLLESSVLVAVRLLVAVVAVVIVLVTAFSSGADRDSEASISCKPADVNVAFSAAAALATSIIMFTVVSRCCSATASLAPISKAACHTDTEKFETTMLN